MKKILAIALVFLMALGIMACEEPTPPSEFDLFLTAMDQTPASKVNVKSTLVTELGTLESVVNTTFNPDGTANIVYSIQNFDPDFESEDVIITIPGQVTVAKDGSYSDGGEFAGTLGDNIASINLTLDATKLVNCKIEGSVLTATVPAENTATVFGAEIESDVSFMLTVSNNRVISITMNYEIASGAMTVICTYN